MARVKLNPILEQLSGKVGDLVFRKYGDDTVISRKPGPSGFPPTPGQVAQRARFRDASFYGRMALANTDDRAFYEAVAARRRQPLFSVIVEDFLKPPVVDEVDAAAYAGSTGEPILIRAHDDVEVTGVTVTLFDGDTELESGPATIDEWRWRYEAQTDVPSGTVVTVTAIATDRPGNTGAESVEVTTS